LIHFYKRSQHTYISICLLQTNTINTSSLPKRKRSLSVLGVQVAGCADHLSDHRLVSSESGGKSDGVITDADTEFVGGGERGGSG